MARRPPHPCNWPGCPALTNDRYCPAHAKEAEQRYDRERGSAASRGYDNRWRKARLTYLRTHPLCECDECQRLGRIMPAEVVDHIIPHRGDQRLFWDTSNWRAMSAACHNRKTALADGGFGRPRA